MKNRLIVLLVLYAPAALPGQNDSANKHGIYLGMHIINAPIIQFLEGENNKSNFASGLLFSINFDNVIAVRAGGNYHFKEYSVFVDKVYDPDVLTVFHYLDLSIALDGYLIRNDKQQSYISLGLAYGKPLYKEGEKRNYSVDYINNENMSYKIGMGYKAPINKKNKLFLGFEPTVMWFVNPVNYRNYSYIEAVDGNHSRSSLALSVVLTYNLTSL